MEEPYSQEALNTALTKLYGNYRVYPLIKSCHDCKDWLTLGMLYDLERQPGTVGSVPVVVSLMLNILSIFVNTTYIRIIPTYCIWFINRQH